MGVIPPLPAGHLRAGFQRQGTALGEVIPRAFGVHTSQSSLSCPLSWTLPKGHDPKREGMEGVVLSSFCDVTRGLCRGEEPGLGWGPGQWDKATTSLRSP